MTPLSCAHCNRELRGYAVVADGSVVCHSEDIVMDCYGLITKQGHRPDGQCCRPPTPPTAVCQDEVPV